MDNVVENEFDVAYWREKFEILSQEIVGEWDRKSLIVYDNFFLSAIGKDAFLRVKTKKNGGLGVTKRVCAALEKVIEFRKLNASIANARAKKQKLFIPNN